MTGRQGISSFSVLLLAAVLAVVGTACFSRLKVQYNPAAGTKDISVSFQYPGASARTVEAEVTAKLEGVLSTIRACSDIRSVSRDGGGTVSLTVTRQADVEAVRFEVASQIRNLYSRLPENCSYPSISLNARGEKMQTAITYNIRSALPSQEIADFVERELLYPLSAVEGVNSVSFYGQTPFEWVITFDAGRAAACGIAVSDIRNAVSEYYADRVVGVTQSGGAACGVRVRSAGAGADAGEAQLAAIPVKRVGERVIHLGDVASFSCREAQPEAYYRINGQNVLTLSVEVSEDANLIGTVRAVKNRLNELRSGFPEEFGIRVEYDYSEYLSEELGKIYFRTALCLAILLLIVFAMTRSWQYMAVIAVTLAVNLLVSVALYYFLGLQIHIYTLAGVTVSLGIIIDNSIVMINHYVRCRNRKVFPSLLCAVLTTVAALLAILLMPEQEKANLTDFTRVIVINLGVSLLVAYLFVPALLDYFPVEAERTGRRSVRYRGPVRLRAAYNRYIGWGVRHRWVYGIVLAAMFGIPVCVLPPRFGDPEHAPLKHYEQVLNKIVGWPPYAGNKSKADKILSSSFGLFYQAMERSDFYRQPARPQLTIRAGMPEGCTVKQLDEVMRSMENFLAHFEEIEVFETRITAYDDGVITVWFKPECEGSWIPVRIKGEIISMAERFGGASWSVYGIDENGFSNNVIADKRMHSISVSGYNFDEVSSYAETLVAWLRQNRRVSDPEIRGIRSGDRPRTEFSLHYDFEALSARGISPYEYYGALQQPLYDAVLTHLPYGGKYMDLRLVSSAKEELDLWHINHSAIDVSADRKVKLSGVGGIDKVRTGLPIQKQNQSYTVTVRFNFIGSPQLSAKFIRQAVAYMNDEVLPIGFHADDDQRGWFYGAKQNYAGLVLLVIAAIFIICAVFFNSLRQSAAVMLMIPLSFVGVFLAFGLTDFIFDKGGFAAFVMLCGITVNAGIYLIAEWRAELERKGGGSAAGRTGRVRQEIAAYVRAFERKIQPILLTILSTGLGLLPFFSDGPSEVFWFAFAVGTVAGLVFSVLALIFYLPVFAISK